MDEFTCSAESLVLLSNASRAYVTKMTLLLILYIAKYHTRDTYQVLKVSNIT